MSRGIARTVAGTVAAAATTALLAGGLVAGPAAAAGPDETVLGSAYANGTIAAPLALGDDGREVLFAADASNLDPRADGRARELYVHDRLTGTTSLVSRGSGPSGAGAGVSELTGDMSSDGRFVVFVSSSTTLAPATPPGSHIFLRDRAAGRTTLVDRASDGTPANGDSVQAMLSDDGSRVAFVSYSSNLGTGSATPQVYVRDLRTGTTTLASRADGVAGAPAAVIDTEAVALSGDGRHVAFVALDPALTAEGDPDAQVYVRDLETGTTRLVSRADGAAGPPADAGATRPAISRDGRRVAFESASSLMPGVGAGGVYVRDLVDATTTLASRADGPSGAALANARLAAISPDGRQVAFRSDAPNAVPGTAITTFQILLRDLTTGRTTIASRAPGAGGAPANGPVGWAVFAADSSALAFAAQADNLLPAVSGVQVYLRLLDGDPPRSLTPPTITGPRRAGATLSCGAGTWAEQPTGFAYAWLRDGVAIPGADQPAYAPTADDLDLPLTCRVTASNRGGAATADSTPTTVPTPGAPGPTGPAGPSGPAGPTGPAGAHGDARLAVALAPGSLRVKRNRTAVVTYLSSAPARLVLTARRGRLAPRRLATTTARRSGRGTVRLRVRLAPGRYRLAVTASAGRHRATDAIGLTVLR